MTRFEDMHYVLVLDWRSSASEVLEVKSFFRKSTALSPLPNSESSLPDSAPFFGVSFLQKYLSI